METKEIMQEIANIHNMLCNMRVSADNAIILGDSLKALRSLLDVLNRNLSSDKEGVDMG